MSEHESQMQSDDVGSQHYNHVTADVPAGCLDEEVDQCNENGPHLGVSGHQSTEQNEGLYFLFSYAKYVLL